MKTGSFSRFLFALSVAAIALRAENSAVIPAAILCVVSAMFIWTGSLKKTLKPARPAALFFAFIMILHLFSHDGTVLFSVFGLRATLEGAQAGLFYGEKLIVFVYSAYLIVETVQPFELVRPVERSARMLGRWGKPISNMALSFSLALRFLPELVRQARTTMMALKTRGMSFEGSLANKAKTALQLTAALYVNAFKSSETASLALAVKGYSTRHARAAFPAPRVRAGSVAAVIFSIMFIVFGLRF